MIDLRWVHNNVVHSAPTAADALAYAEQLLADVEEFQCCLTDYRMPELTRVRQLLEETKDERR